jgi:hypothetical protein
MPTKLSNHHTYANDATAAAAGLLYVFRNISMLRRDLVPSWQPLPDWLQRHWVVAVAVR